MKGSYHILYSIGIDVLLRIFKVEYPYHNICFRKIILGHIRLEREVNSVRTGT